MEDTYHIILFYRYAPVPAPEELAAWHKDFAQSHALTGRVLIATEGINGTLASASEANILAYMEELVRVHPAFAGIHWKRSSTTGENPFPDTHIRHTKELISSGGKFHDAMGPDGHHLPPADFHKLLSETPKEDLIVVDVRNHKECMLGSFKGAIDPQTRVFSEMPTWIDKHVDELKDKKIALFCTGGIRCERTSQYIRGKFGFESVYQLQGGIHTYLEEFPDGGLYEGKNFVFDRRGAMGAKDNDKVVGKCYLCQAPWDEFDARTVCTVCRDALLVCPECRHVNRCEFHCETHRHLQECYFTFLDVFTDEELKAQHAQLKTEHTQLCGEHVDKNRRRTMMKQMRKIENLLEARAKGEAQVKEFDPERVPCRSCGEESCQDGGCWGFWGKDVLEKKKKEEEEKKEEK